jgi:hypothetical protein
VNNTATTAGPQPPAIRLVDSGFNDEGFKDEGFNDEGFNDEGFKDQ